MKTQQNVIAEITDASLGFGAQRALNAQEQTKARAIIRDAQGRYAVMRMDAEAASALPGGSIEPGETPEQAVVREAAEETGWNCRILACLGQVIENRGQLNAVRRTHYFVMERVSPAREAKLTQEEIEEGTRCQWCGMGEALRLIRGDSREREPQIAFRRARDLAALEAYRVWACRQALGKRIDVLIDRPLGSAHPRHPDMIYPVNYGYVPGVIAGDGSAQDVYVLGIDAPQERIEQVRVIAVYHRFDDDEDKWIAVPEGGVFTDAEIMEKIFFTEQYFHGELIR